MGEYRSSLESGILLNRKFPRGLHGQQGKYCSSWYVNAEAMRSRSQDLTYRTLIESLLHSFYRHVSLLFIRTALRNNNLITRRRADTTNTVCFYLECHSLVLIVQWHSSFRF